MIYTSRRLCTLYIAFFVYYLHDIYFTDIVVFVQRRAPFFLFIIYYYTDIVVFVQRRAPFVDRSIVKEAYDMAKETYDYEMDCRRTHVQTLYFVVYMYYVILYVGV